MDRHTNSRLNCRYIEQAYLGYRLGPNGHGERLDVLRSIQAASQSIPANSEILSSTPNENQERHNSPSVLQYIEEGVNRMLMVSRIVSEAKARGKAAGYADGNTTTWKV